MCMCWCVFEYAYVFECVWEYWGGGAICGVDVFGLDTEQPRLWVFEGVSLFQIVFIYNQKKEKEKTYLYYGFIMATNYKDEERTNENERASDIQYYYMER